MLCREVMRKQVFVCDEDESVAECARTMRDRNVGFLPVVDAHGLVSGVVTDRDLAIRVLAHGGSAAMPVGAVMTRDVRICQAHETLRAAERRMAEVRRSRLVVVDSAGRCIGVISVSDIAQADSRAQAGHLLYELTQSRAAATAPRA
jgi:CBS domain-containing protein